MEIAATHQQFSVSLSQDGTRLAIGGSGYKNGSVQRAGSLKIYDYDSITSTWSQLGSTILGVTEILVWAIK